MSQDLSQRLRENLSGLSGTDNTAGFFCKHLKLLEDGKPELSFRADSTDFILDSGSD